MKLSKSIPVFTILVAFMSSLFAEDVQTPVAQPEAEAKSIPNFTEDELAQFKEERAKIARSGAIGPSMFVNADFNKDGIWTWEEFNAQRTKAAKKHGKGQTGFRPDFDRFDSNKDGFVTIIEQRKEFQGWLNEKKASEKKLKEAQEGDAGGDSTAGEDKERPVVEAK